MDAENLSLQNELSILSYKQITWTKWHPFPKINVWRIFWVLKVCVCVGGGGGGGGGVSAFGHMVHSQIDEYLWERYMMNPTCWLHILPWRDNPFYWTMMCHHLQITKFHVTSSSSIESMVLYTEMGENCRRRMKFCIPFWIFTLNALKLFGYCDNIFYHSQFQHTGSPNMSWLRRWDHLQKNKTCYLNN